MATGLSALCTFPFRMYAAEALDQVEFSTDDARVRVYSPISLRENTPAISPDFPFVQWPFFRWSPFLGARQRLRPPRLEASPSLGPHKYDALRVDLWTDLSPEPALLEFVQEFLAWLRLLSGQDWIGRYELHTERHRKYGFPIDGTGRCTATPYGYGLARLKRPWAKPIDNKTWENSVRSAALRRAIPEYWTLFLDAHLSQVEGDVRGAVLRLSLALEVARNVCLAGFADSDEHPVLGPRLGKPFQGTDLLKHLTTHLQEAHPSGANAENDLGEYWGSVKSLYIARHHVAHGRPAVSRFGGQMRTVVNEDLDDFLVATFAGLKWLESLQQSS